MKFIKYFLIIIILLGIISFIPLFKHQKKICTGGKVLWQCIGEKLIIERLSFWDYVEALKIDKREANIII